MTAPTGPDGTPWAEPVPLPKALIPSGPIPNDEQRRALGRLAASILAADNRYPALGDILARARPRVASGPRDVIQTTDPSELRRLAASLDASYLFIQGPPGSGKTWTGARIIVELMRQGRRVGVSAPSHNAIHNLLDEVHTAAREAGVRFRGLKKASGSDTGGSSGLYQRRAIELAAKLGMAPLVAHCNFSLAKLSARAGNQHQAEDHYAEATKMYREMGMTYWLERAEAAREPRRLLSSAVKPARLSPGRHRD